MYKKITCKVLMLIALLMCGFSLLTACGSKDDTAGAGKKGVMEFEDFTVERSVRETLGKSWDENITYQEVASIKKLVINSLYDPSIYGTTERMYHKGYIDLIDLEEFINLEELILNTYVTDEYIANLETIANCKKLKRLSVPCSLYGDNSDGLIYAGYKYWADIIAELPELEYLDLGMYVDEHMKKAMLAKTDNKDIEFYQGEVFEEEDGEVSGYQKYYAIKSKSPYRISATKDYNAAWDYTFYGYARMYRNWYMIDGRGDFPVIYGTKEEVEEQLNKLSEDTEDIIIALTDNNFDFSVLGRFENLVTLTVVGTVEAEKYFNENTQLFEYGNIIYTECSNLDTLLSLEHLQVLSLNSMCGDFSTVTKCKKLREVILYGCYPESLDFISELNQVKELSLYLIPEYDNDVEENAKYLEKLGEEVCTLNNVKMYRELHAIKASEDDNSAPDYYANISNMSSLETLYLRDCECQIESILKSSTIRNLIIQDFELSKQNVDKISFDNMQNLESINLGNGVIAYSDIDFFDIESLLELPKLRTVYYPRLIEDIEEVFTPELADKMAAHKKLSAFTCRIGREYMPQYNKSMYRSYMKKLYDADIYCGVGYFFLRGEWSKGNTECSYDDIMDIMEQ